MKRKKKKIAKKRAKRSKRVEQQKPTHQIRITHEVYEALAAKAEPMKDKPDDVLRRMLGLPPRERRVPKG